MYIDARHEKFHLGNAKQVIFKIKGAKEDHIKQKIFEAIGMNTLRIEVIPENEKVTVTYYENIISPTYMDYRLNLKGLEFNREGG